MCLVHCLNVCFVHNTSPLDRPTRSHAPHGVPFAAVALCVCVCVCVCSHGQQLSTVENCQRLGVMYAYIDIRVSYW